MFSKAMFEFLEELQHNNNREWFEANKERYGALVREPALDFIAAMAPQLAGFAPHFIAVPKRVGGSLMRVFRDVRFSRDKTPYKTNVGIQFRHEVGKDVHAPGFYLHLANDGCFLGAGIWHPESEVLKKIRAYMDEHPKPWLEAKDALTERGYRLEGDSLKRAPQGYAEIHPLIEDIRRKDFIGILPLERDDVIGKEVTGRVSKCFGEVVPFMQFLCRAVGVPY